MTLPPVMQIAFDEELSSSDSPQALKRRITSDGLLEELERRVNGVWNSMDTPIAELSQQAKYPVDLNSVLLLQVL